MMAAAANAAKGWPPKWKMASFCFHAQVVVGPEGLSSRNKSRKESFSIKRPRKSPSLEAFSFPFRCCCIKTYFHFLALASQLLTTTTTDWQNI